MFSNYVDILVRYLYATYFMVIREHLCIFIYYIILYILFVYNYFNLKKSYIDLYPIKRNTIIVQLLYLIENIDYIILSLRFYNKD